MAEPLTFLEFGASREEAEMTVVLMHGLGDSGHGFADVAQMICQTAAPAKWRFVLPHAPNLPVTCNGGFVMPAWYDILDMSHPRNVDWATVDASEQALVKLIEEQASEKLVLAGFSQGGAMALHLGLRMQERVSGIISMSGYLLESAEHPCPEKKADVPIGIFHGDVDDVVPLLAAEQTEKTLKEQGFAPDKRVYPGVAHSLSMDEIRDVYAWLQAR